MEKSDMPVRTLVDKIVQGELRLPEMQREYVWPATRVRDLLDSLYRGYPSGVILAWEPGEDVDLRETAVATGTGLHARPLLLLDGQQRLTSLAAVTRGEPVKVRGHSRPVEILFNLDHPDELTYVDEVDEHTDDGADSGDDEDNDLLTRLNRRTFMVSSRRAEAEPNWVKVTDVFKREDAEILQDAGVTGFDDPNYARYSKRLAALKAINEYQYRVDTLESSKSYQEVTEIFVRVNSLGAKLRSSDLALAQITAQWRGSLSLFLEYQEKIRQRGFALDVGIFLRTMVALVTGQSRFKTVGSIGVDDLKSGWERAKKAFDHAVNFAISAAGIDSPMLLSSPFLLVAAAYWADWNGYQHSAEEAVAFRRWFLLANAKGRYSRGATETALDQDLAEVRSGSGVQGLIDRLVQQVGRLDFTAADLAGRSTNSGAFKTMFLAYQRDGAEDWSTHLPISAKHSGYVDKIEFHHIFPRAYLKTARPDLVRAQVNDIANMAFIGAATNKLISDRPPAEYQAIFDSESLALQQVYIPSGAGYGSDFETFIIRRRQAMAEKLNEFLHTTSKSQD